MKLQLTKTTLLDSNLLPSGINAWAPIDGLTPHLSTSVLAPTQFLLVIVTFAKVGYQVVAMVSSGASICFDIKGQPCSVGCGAKLWPPSTEAVYSTQNH